MEAIKIDSICTHYYDFIINIKPYEDSIFFPTNKYINKIIGIPFNQINSIDIKLPSKYGSEEYGDPLNIKFYEAHIIKYKPFLSLAYFENMGKICSNILNIDNIEFHKYK